MKGIATFAFLFFVQTSFARSCKCLYGEACWPTDEQFTSLQSQLSQPLIYPRPPEAACYPASNPSGNCTEVVLNATNGRWRSDQPGSLQNTNFETYTFPNGTISACYPNASLGFPCEQGSVSPIGVDARSVQDIQATVRFASKYDLKLVVKNTGHDYLGRSAARNSLLLWTHHLKNISYDGEFVPEGAPSNETYAAITLGAGVQWYEAYDAAQAQGRIVVGGLSLGASIGAAGGWVAGGGHSALSPQHGLGADNAIQFSVVTSDGTLLTVNSHQHSDLFWALRGGGGGTYGVVTSVTYKTYPSIPVVLAVIETNFSTPQIAQDVVTEFVNTSTLLADAGWGGYVTFDSTVFEFTFLAPNVSQDNATAVLSPLISVISNATADQVLIDFIPFDSFYDAYIAAFSGSGQVGANVEVSSRLMPRAVIEKDPARVAQTLLSMKGAQWDQVAGGAVSRVDPDSAGLNPAWRQAIASVTTGGTWADGSTLAEINQVRDYLKSAVGILQSVAGPGSGAYFNEASLYEPDPQVTFFGLHYSELERIKSTYDPHDIFLVAEGVGSEKWDKNLICYL